MIGVLILNHCSFFPAVISLTVATVSVFLIWALPSTHAAVVGVSSVFSGVIVVAFASMSLSEINIYEVSVR